MFVNEFNAVSARDLNQQLNKVYNWQLNLTKINENDASRMLTTIQNKITNIRKTNQAHYAERIPEYMEAVMVGKVLETWKNEMAHGRKIIAEKMAAIDAYCMTQLNERKMTPHEQERRHELDMSMKDKIPGFTKRYGKKGADVYNATLTKLAMKKKTNESIVLPPSLTEGEIEQARVTMAARDLADTVQDIVEKISKMQNEQLPALVSAMKDEVGMEQANSFNDTTKQVLGSLLDAANGARDTLDNASRGVYGGGEMDTGAAPDMGGADMGEPAPDMNAPLGGDGAITPPRGGDSELDAADTAVGGNAELGRGRRA